MRQRHLSQKSAGLSLAGAACSGLDALDAEGGEGGRFCSGNVAKPLYLPKDVFWQCVSGGIFLSWSATVKLV